MGNRVLPQQFLPRGHREIREIESWGYETGRQDVLAAAFYCL